MTVSLAAVAAKWAMTPRSRREKLEARMIENGYFHSKFAMVLPKNKKWILIFKEHIELSQVMRQANNN